MAVVSPLVRVLTPVHNGEEHIARCIESVVQQTYDNWEYAVVDNCSSDRTSEIVQAFARQDSRIRYVRHDDLVEVTASYNRTLEQDDERSVYTKVVGADDLLYPECLRRMVDLAEGNPSVGIVSAYRMDESRVDLVGVPKHKSVIPGHEILRQSLGGGPYVTGSPTSVLLRTDLVRRRRPFYDAAFRHADTEAAYWVMTQSDFGVVHEVLTFTRRRQPSETAASVRMGTYYPENTRMLLRYGPTVFDEGEYRRHLRRALGRYVWMHTKWRLRPAGRRDNDFHAFHLRQVELIRSEGGDDHAVLCAMAATRLLLGNATVAD